MHPSRGPRLSSEPSLRVFMLCSRPSCRAGYGVTARVGPRPASGRQHRCLIPRPMDRGRGRASRSASARCGSPVPDRVYFSARGETKLDLARYYMSVGDGIVRALRERPCMLHRFPERRRRRQGPPEAHPLGRAAVARDRPDHLPPLRPHRRRAVRDRAGQRDLGGADVDRRVPPVELAPRRRRAARRVADRHRSRCRSASFDCVRRVAHVAHEVLDELRITGWPKTSGGSGLHIYVRIEPRWGFQDVRRAALAFAREVERRAPDDATTVWWRKDRDPRQGVRRLQPERARPHDRLRLLGPRHARARSRPPSAGTSSTTSSPRS